MTLKIFTDGGARGNPGPAAAGYVVYDDAGNLREKRGKPLGKATNNEAEYQAVIEALEYARGLKNQVTSIGFFLDSQLVVNQLNGIFKIKEPRLRNFKVKIQELENGLAPAKITYSYVPRAENWQADKLVNETLDRLQFSYD